ncbi:hypothetical protein [Thermoplasma sp.]|uniref:hypothetical protein n=1 Tax=Thermoplasma sp. TaxID=1973142 RepID=UPI001283DDBD|nr:hypothetical protein [Thermoplasma sp.]KAA8922843.1 MAG: sodium:calcium antiporter [Thermoplasma sp.]
MRKPHSIEILSSLAILSIIVFLSAASSLIYISVFFIFSLFVLVYSSDLFFDNAVPMFRSVGIGDMYAGTIFVGLASVLDEIALSVSSLVFRHPEIGMGAVEGSNLITMIFFTVIMAVSYLRVVRIFTVDMIMIVMLTTISIIFAEIFVSVPWYGSIVLFIPFIIYLIIKMRSNIVSDHDARGYSKISLVVSFFLIFISSDVLVRSTLGIAAYTGISIVDLSAYGIGIISSLPEVIMILVSLMGGKKIVSMGIFTGSTIYKMSLIPAFIVAAEPTGFSDLIYMLLAILCMSLFVLALSIISGRRWSRVHKS